MGVFCGDCKNYKYSNRSENWCKITTGTSTSYHSVKSVRLIPSEANKDNSCANFIQRKDLLYKFFSMFM